MELTPLSFFLCKSFNPPASEIEFRLETARLELSLWLPLSLSKQRKVRTKVL
jgi:hypothetical protein